MKGTTKKNVQKCCYLEIIDTEDGYQIYKFTAYANSDNDLIDLDNNLYKVTNLTPAKDNSFNVTITTSIRLHIDKEHAPISKPIAHSISNTTNYANITKAGYTSTQ